MYIGVVGMAVHELFMPMRMDVRFCPVPGEVVDVPMMRVVAVRVRMLHRFVHVFVLVSFTDVQPHAQRHRGAGRPE